MFWLEYKLVKSLWKILKQFLPNLNILTLWLSHSTSHYIPNKNNCMCTKKDMYNSITGSFIYNSLKLEATQMPNN